MESRDVVVLGAGIAGLVAGYEFSKRGKRVLLLDKANQPGGALRASKVKSYFVDEFYHHIYPHDKLAIKLCEELGVTVDWKYINTAFFEKGIFYRLTKPYDLFTFTPLSWKNKIALMRLMLKIKFIDKEDYQKYDQISAKDFLIQQSSAEVYEKLFRTLLEAKYGDNLERISAAWIIERLKERSNRNLRGEKLGYVRGGFHILTNALVTAIEKKEGKLKCTAVIEKMDLSNTPATIHYQHSGKKHTVTAKTVVSTLPPPVLMQFVSLPEEYAERLRKLEYIGACCVLAGLRKPLTPHYWTNIMEPARFGVVVEQTNFVDAQNYAGDHYVYLSRYPDSKSDLWKMTEEQVGRAFLEDMNRLFGKQEVLWHRVFRLPVSGIVYHKGIKDHIVPVTTPIPNLFVAGIFNSYPERGIDRAAALVHRIVNAFDR